MHPLLRKLTIVSTAFLPFSKIVPVDINLRGFEMLDYLQGHWVGSMTLMEPK